ncbi:hypothetical protein DLJ53_26700 [Acuticoccus sediminis]|uniref:Flagellar protein FlgN n=1 Tax=Acuticoccus sediminis TaxID=2184697 RepID=A0A8B2NGP7_9HYPH|nr:hypothetical protein [Acuticoccus sediminis]RAH98301.1 hypothetical protein DLJ53_26700 [Acuticoccus sediminis]
MTTGITSAVSRLEGLIDTSIAAMKASASIDDKALADAKGRALLELSRLGHYRPGDDEQLLEQVRRLRTKLATEEKLLMRRLEAARVIAEIVTEAVLAEESDGTYEPRPRMMSGLEALQ